MVEEDILLGIPLAVSRVVPTVVSVLCVGVVEWSRGEAGASRSCVCLLGGEGDGTRVVYSLM